jgi:hypothetical protein
MDIQDNVYLTPPDNRDDLVRRIVELVPTLMIDDLDKSCAKAEPNFDK